MVVRDDPEEDDESESVYYRVAFGWPNMALGNWSNEPYLCYDSFLGLRLQSAVEVTLED